MGGWRQTFYTFLLRRVLGPYLSQESLQQLYSSIDVSLQEGRFSLTDVELNAAYLTSKQNVLSIHYVRIKKLQIRLTLREKDETPTSSVTWRAMNLGRDGAGISLEAHLEFDGVEIHLGPPIVAPSKQGLADMQGQDVAKQQSSYSSTAASRTVGSYVDAALASMRLSLDVKNLKVRMLANDEKWIELDLAFARYHDRHSHDTAMHKAIDFSGIMVQTCAANRKELISKLEGGGQLTLRANNVGVEGKLQQDISVSLYQRISLSVGDQSLRCILGVLNAFSGKSGCEAPSQGSALAASQYYELPSNFGLYQCSEGSEHDEQDIQTIKGIMEQYAEARHLAERNEVRGGILVQDDDTMSFDAFFDANDLSFSTYQSTLERSFIFKASAATDADDYVHTQIKFHLGECRIKVSFPNPTDNLPAEYLLISFADCNASAAISNRSSEHTFSVGRLSAEASQLSADGLPEIERICCFEQDDDSSSIVSTSSCLEVHLSIQGLTKKSVDVRLRALTVFYNHRTLENVTSLQKMVLQDYLVPEPPSFAPETPTQTMSLSVWVAAVTILVPVVGVPDSTLHTLFQRCGYRVDDELPRNSVFLGLSLDDAAFATLNAAVDDIADGVTGEKGTCHRALVFVAAPVARGSTVIHRVDIVALAGQIPLSVKHSKRSQLRSSPSVGESIFPKVPAMSSFKAREDDDDTHGSDRAEIMNALRSADPQPSLMRIAHECHETMEVQIPDVTLDLTKGEVQALADVIGGVKLRSSGDEGRVVADADDSRQISAKSVAVSVGIGQVTLCAHCDRDSFSFKVIGRDWKVFAAKQGSKVSCLRAMTHDIDLYAAQHLIYRPSSNTIHGAITISDRCDGIRRRTVRNPLTKSMPIMYRSQLFPPLSPKSPAILLDLINGSDEECSEWTIHFSIYNMTHRAAVSSPWCTHAQEFFQSGHQRDSLPVDKAGGKPGDSRSALTRVFVTLTDCNVDYTSCMEFRQASRTIVRFSDVRLSSNIVSPPQPLQAFSLSVGDATLLIGNKRHPYNSENACFSRSVTILGPDDLDVVNELVPAPDLQQMNLVTVLTLDSFVAGVTLRTADEEPPRNKGHEPKVSLNLTFGYLCLYGCKDSFECLMETVGDLNLKFTGLTKDDVEDMRQNDLLRNLSGDDGSGESDASGDQRFFDTNPSDSKFAPAEARPLVQDDCARINVENKPAVKSRDTFELDGYDWTAIDHKWSNDELPAGEEQVARWFDDSPADDRGRSIPEVRSTIGSDPMAGKKKLHLIPHHIQLRSSLNPLAEGDMDAARHAGTNDAPPVKVRTVVRDLKARCRFFDGYDWPQDVKKRKHPPRRNYAFIIDDTLDRNDDQADETEQSRSVDPIQSRQDRKKKLLGALLDGEDSGAAVSTFRDVPLAEERGTMLMDKAEQRRLARRIHCFFQVSLCGLQLRVDSFEETYVHRLASCLDLSIEDLFIAETISNAQPTKMFGEWVNDVEHPRDSKHGLLMMRMVTWNPKHKVTADNKIAPQESEAVLQFLPLRCRIYQQSLRFARAFFTTGEELPAKRWASHLTEIPPPVFVSTRVKPCKLKVDYTPDKVDVAALRNGSVVELINISPLNDMVILLDAVDMDNKVGFGEVFTTLARSWVQDICSTQLHKFLTSNSAFQPISSISNGAIDMVVLPWDAVKSGNSVSKAVKKGVFRFAESVVYETLNVGTKVTNVAAAVLSSASLTSAQRSALPTLPSRPAEIPRSLLDTTDHSLDILAKGFETANYKIIIIPYREYRRHGAAGAVASAVKGIPVAVMAPMGAASEAISYTLLGARNQVRPEIRKEDEASQRGL
ncbi:autophagy of peroxisome [Fragilaria crotonensis]|nr:autophagy of peroxisome [Fragilaria crotonensis]